MMCRDALPSIWMNMSSPRGVRFTTMAEKKAVRNSRKPPRA